MKKLILCILMFLAFQSPVLAPADIAVVDTAVAEAQEEISGEWVLMEVTAYTAGPESTGKTPGHPLYGITASRAKVRKLHTVAAGKSIPFGTRLFIPAFAADENRGWFVVEDRGAKVGDGNIDIYMESLEEARRFGRRQMYVFVAGHD